MQTKTFTFPRRVIRVAPTPVLQPELFTVELTVGQAIQLRRAWTDIVASLSGADHLRADYMLFRQSPLAVEAALSKLFHLINRRINYAVQGQPVAVILTAEELYLLKAIVRDSEVLMVNKPLKTLELQLGWFNQLTALRKCLYTSH